MEHFHIHFKRLKIKSYPEESVANFCATMKNSSKRGPLLALDFIFFAKKGWTSLSMTLRIYSTGSSTCYNSMTKLCHGKCTVEKLSALLSSKDPGFTILVIGGNPMFQARLI